MKLIISGTRCSLSFFFFFLPRKQPVNLIIQWDPLQLLYWEMRGITAALWQNVCVCVCMCECVFGQHIAGSLELQELQAWTVPQFLKSERLQSKHWIPVILLTGHVDHTVDHTMDQSNLKNVYQAGSKQPHRLFRTVSRLQNLTLNICYLAFSGLSSLSAVTVCGCVRHNDRCQTRQQDVCLCFIVHLLSLSLWPCWAWWLP